MHSSRGKSDQRPSRDGSADPPISADEALRRDRRLLAAWAAGDDDAGLQLMALYHQYFLSLCFKYGIRDSEGQVEFYQELLLRVLQILPRLELQSSFAGYLRRVFNTAFRETRRREAPTWYEGAATLAAAVTLGTVDRDEIARAIVDCAGRLTDREESVFRGRLLEELEFAELRERLSLSLANLHVIYHRARQKMRACLERKGFAIP